MEHFLEKPQRNHPINAIKMSMVVFMLPFLAYNISIAMAEGNGSHGETCCW
jgi:hypothetical protein